MDYQPRFLGHVVGAAGPAFDGSFVFDAGQVPDGSASQTINLASAGFTAAEIDSGILFAVFSGRVRTIRELTPDLGTSPSDSSTVPAT